MDQEYFNRSSVVYLLMTIVNLSANEQFEILSSQICTPEVQQLNNILSSVNQGYFFLQFLQVFPAVSRINSWLAIIVGVNNSLTPTQIHQKILLFFRKWSNCTTDNLLMRSVSLGQGN